MPATKESILAQISNLNSGVAALKAARASAEQSATTANAALASQTAAYNSDMDALAAAITAIVA